MYVALAVVTVVSVLGLVFRRPLRERTMRRHIAAMAAQLDAPPDAGIRAAATRAYVQDRATVSLSGQTRGLLTAASAPAAAAGTQQHVDWMESLLNRLQRHSLVAAGTEQALLNALTVADPAVLALSIQYLSGVIPDQLHQAGAKVVEYLHSGEFALAKVEAAQAFAQSSMESLLRHGDSIVTHLAGLKLGALGGDIGSVLGSGLGHGSLTLATSALQDASIVEAGQHLLVAAHAVNSADALTGVGGHFPAITAALVTVREVKLLTQGNKTLGEAVFHGTVDIAGTGGGAFLGGKAGALIGTAFMPGVGTILGGLIGAIGGAILGKGAANRIIEAKLREEVEEYERLQREYAELVRTYAAAMSSAVSAQLDDEQQVYDKAIGVAPDLGRTHRKALTGLLDDMRRSTDAHHGRTRELVLKAQPLLDRYPGLAQPAQRIQSRLHEVDRLLKTAGASSDRDEPLRALVAVATAATLIPHAGFAGRRHEARCRRASRRLDKMTRRNGRKVAKWNVRAVAEYRTRSENLSATVEQQCTTFKSNCENATGPLRAQAEVVRKEAAKLDR